MSEKLLTPGQVAKRFQVHPQTIARWADQGRIHAVRSPSGHRRFRLADVESLEAAQGGAR